MSLNRLRDMLSDVGSLMEAAGSKKAAAEVREFADALPGQADGKAVDAVANLRELLEEERAGARRRYVDRLEGAGSDRAEFEAVYAHLKRDKQMLKDDVDAIAHSYIGGREKWPSKAAALKSIRNRFADRSYAESKMKLVDKAKVW